MLDFIATHYHIIILALVLAVPAIPVAILAWKEVFHDAYSEYYAVTILVMYSICQLISALLFFWGANEFRSGETTAEGFGLAGLMAFFMIALWISALGFVEEEIQNRKRRFW